MSKDSYWTPSRYAKILITAFALGLPANLCTCRKEKGWKWLTIASPSVETRPRDSVAALLVNTTTSLSRFLLPPSWLPCPPTCSTDDNDKIRNLYVLTD